MSANPQTHRRTQRRFRNVAIVLAALVAVIAVPLMVMSQQRLELGYRLGIVPGGGSDVQQVAGPNDGAILVVVPFRAPGDAYGSAYRQRAQYLARPSEAGMTLEDLSGGASIAIPLQDLDFIAASDDGSIILFREGTAPSSARSVVVDVTTGKVTDLPAGTLAPDLPGDWTTPVWAKVGTQCGMRSVTSIYIACFPNPTLATYLFGDWQLDLQLYGDYQISRPLFRGLGFVPSLGWTNDDQTIWFQNERGIWKIALGPNPLDLPSTPAP
ncbi:MAG: hypothetical protein QM753_14145 [Thermomicrobiales bacterium]